MSRLLVLISLVPLASPFFFNLPGLTPPAPAQCCPPPACGGGGGYAPPPPPSYEAPPMYQAPPPPAPYAAPPPPSYATGLRKKRASPSGELEASSGDMLCNSPDVRDAIKKNMSSDEKETRSAIHRSLRDELEREMVVLCTANPFDFTVSHDAEYCAVKGEKFTCYAFVF